MSVAKNLLDSAYHYLVDSGGEYVTDTDATCASLASQRATLAMAGSTHTSKDRHIPARSTGATVIARSTGHDIFSRGGTPQLSTPKSPLIVGQAHPYIPYSNWPLYLSI